MHATPGQGHVNMEKQKSLTIRYLLRAVTYLVQVCIQVRIYQETLLYKEYMDRSNSNHQQALVASTLHK